MAWHTVAELLRGSRSARDDGDRQGLGAHPPRLEGRALVPPRARRLLLRPHPGRWPERPRQLPGRGPAPDHRLLGRGRRHADRVAGQGAGVRDQGDRGPRGRLGRRSATPIRSRPSATPTSTCARSRTCGRAPTPSARWPACATRWRMAVHRFFHERGFYWVHTPIITASDAEGAGEHVPRLHARPGQPARAPRTARSTSRRTSSAARPILTVSGQLNVETYCLALTPRLHLRPDLPRRELQHQPAPGRVLDDRAGDRLRRPERQRRPGRGLPAVHLPGRARRAGRRHGVLRRARGQDGRHAARDVRRRRASSA